MTNAWFSDAHTKEGELKAFDAERAERRGNLPAARTLYSGAATAFQNVALRVPVDHPNTRADLTIAAVACFARAGDFGQAVDLANRMLAEPDGLSPYGRGELERMANDYSRRLAATTPMAPQRAPFRTLPARALLTRGQVRDQARRTSKRAA